jgi:hypothetical protein
MIVAGLSVVQGRTIDSQRNVIRILFSDSRELTSIKMHEQQQKRSAAANAQGDQQQKSAPNGECADSKDKAAGCKTPQAATPRRQPQENNHTPEKSDDDNSLPNPQRLLHSI